MQSFAIEGDTLNPIQIRDSLQASLEARNASPAASSGNAYAHVADVMVDARNVAQTVARLNGWQARLFEQSRLLKDGGRLRADQTGPLQVVNLNHKGDVSEVHFQAPPATALPGEMAQVY